MFLVMAFLSRYMIPTKPLLPYYEEWLIRKKQQTNSLERTIKHIMVNFKIMSTPENVIGERFTHVTWPPSVTELTCFDN